MGSGRRNGVREGGGGNREPRYQLRKVRKVPPRYGQPVPFLRNCGLRGGRWVRRAGEGSEDEPDRKTECDGLCRGGLVPARLPHRVSHAREQGAGSGGRERPRPGCWVWGGLGGDPGREALQRECDRDGGRGSETTATSGAQRRPNA